MEETRVTDETVVVNNPPPKHHWLRIVILLGSILLFLAVAVGLVVKKEVNKRIPEFGMHTIPSAVISAPVNTPLPSQDKSQPNIYVSSPTKSAVVSLPFSVTGRARVFENQLNYQLLTASGKVLIEGTAYAQSPDAGEFGPFAFTIDSLPNPTYSPVILEVFDYSAKDGVKQDIVSLPISINMLKAMDIKVFFLEEGATDCTAVTPVRRFVPKTEAVAKIALNELLKGVFAVEKEKKLTTQLPPFVTLNSVTITDGVARADFSKELGQNVAGSCKVQAIRSQIIQTLKQFDTVKDVVISIDGKIEGILQP